MPLPFVALAPVICSLIMASTAVTGGSIAVGARVVDSRAKRRQSEQEKAVKAYVDRFSVITYSLEHEQNSIFVPLLLILNREHKELRQFYSMLNLLPSASAAVTNACPYGVGDVIHPVYQDRSLQKRPLIVKSRTIANLFGSKSATLAYPAENIPLWLTEYLYISITESQVNFHVLDDANGQRDWNALKTLIDFLAPKEQRAERIRKYILGTHPGDRPHAALPEPLPAAELIPIIPPPPTPQPVTAQESEGWVMWGLRKVVGFYRWLWSWVKG